MPRNPFNPSLHKKTVNLGGGSELSRFVNCDIYNGLGNNFTICLQFPEFCIQELE